MDPLLPPDEVAEYLGVPVKTLYAWRAVGKGPAGVRVGRHLRYSMRDVLAWLDDQRENEKDTGRVGR